MLEQYGNDVVCIDSTHGINAYDFELTPIVVLDDKREGFPAVLILCNHQDEEAMLVAFRSMNKLVTINPKLFMSDDAESFYNAWKKVFGESHRLLCS